MALSSSWLGRNSFKVKRRFQASLVLLFSYLNTINV
nr:MAG TPA: PLASMEPSIN II [Bacteriophage sp.]